jgi:HEPN domain-containing protein
MTPEEILQYWINLSDNDLAVAETLVKNKHNIYACFMCQQAVEKMFKGYYAKTKNDTPPFRHELKVLAQKTGLYDLLDDVQKSFIIKLSPFNIEARYPDYQNKIAQNLTDEDTKNIFDQTKEFVQWIKQKI